MYQYKGLTPHDLRRSAVRNLTNGGVGKATAMKITGHRTVSVFERYNIASTKQLHEAIEMVSNNARTTQNAGSVSRKLLKSRGSSVVEQPIRNRQVAGSSPALGSKISYIFNVLGFASDVIPVAEGEIVAVLSPLSLAR